MEVNQTGLEDTEKCVGLHDVCASGGRRRLRTVWSNVKSYDMERLGDGCVTDTPVETEDSTGRNEKK